MQFTNAGPYSVVLTDDGGAITSRLALGPVTDRNLLLTLRAETLQIANPWMIGPPALVTVETRRFHAAVYTTGADYSFRGRMSLYSAPWKSSGSN